MLCNQLRPQASRWEDIAKGLGFLPGEIANIKADGSRLMSAPGSYMDAVLDTWMNWGPRDERGTTDVATLEQLQRVLNSLNLSRLELTLQ